MAPDVHFHLTHDAYDHFAQLLAPHDVTVSDTIPSESRPESQHPAVSESASGVLRFRGHDFSYSRHKSVVEDMTPRDNPNIQILTTYLSVSVLAHEPLVLEELFSLLEQVFPQPNPQLNGLTRRCS